MKTLEGKNTNLIAARRIVPILADKKTKELPDVIEIIKAGEWGSGSVKGPLTITTADLYEFKANFDAGIGIAGGGAVGIPIDFAHEDWSQAAGWITEIEVAGDTLLAHVEWTKAGAEMLEGGMYKCISPSFYPACLGQWQDPEDSDVTARNVLVGAGLTNIPFFKDLRPIMASKNSSQDDADRKENNVIYIKADERKSMSLDEIRVKEAAALTDEEKQYLLDHKDELSAEEVEKFQLSASAPETPEATETPAPAVVEEAPAVNPIEQVVNNEANAEEAPTEDVAEAVAVMASVKAGEKVVMAATEVQAMKSKIEAADKELAEYRTAKVKASVEKHLERGAIKADQVDKWTERILADATVADLLEGLNDNAVMASEKGGDVVDVANAAEAFEQEVQAHIKASGASYAEAVMHVAKKNPDLANRKNQENK